MKLLILGAGAWGTALAVQACHRHQVTLWGRQAAHIQDLLSHRVNQHYLPGCPLPEQLHLSHLPLSELIPDHDLLLLAVPMAGLRQLLTDIKDVAPSLPVAWLCKGFEAVTKGESAAYGLMAHEVQQQVAPGLQAGVLSEFCTGSRPWFASRLGGRQPSCTCQRHAGADLSCRQVACLRKRRCGRC